MAYTLGSIGMNGSPKSVENVGTGSVIPRSVPATLDVNPVTKWYIAASLLSLEIGGSTPKLSAVRKMTAFGIPPTPGIAALLMYSIGYPTRVLSVILLSL